MNGIRIEGDIDKFKAQFNKLENIDKVGINSSLAEVLRSSTLQRFSKGVSPTAEKWQTSKRVEESGGQTLVDTSRLRNSIRAKSNEAGFAIGTNVIYAATHQFGDERTIKAKTNKGLRFKMNGRYVNKKEVNINIPARPFLGISKDDLKEIEATMIDALR